MPTVPVYNLKKEKVREIELPEAIFGVELKPHLVHEVVVAQLASRRSGSAATKTRSDIHGTTRKMYRQKGTGRARAGSIKSPLRRGGGTIFGPHPRDFSMKPNKKVRRGAMKSVLTAKLMEESLLVLDAFELQEIKTKEFVNALRTLGVEKAVIVTPGQDEKLEKSSRNVQGFKVLRVDGLNCYDVLKHHHLILLEGSLPRIEERLLK